MLKLKPQVSLRPVPLLSALRTGIRQDGVLEEQDRGTGQGGMKVEGVDR